MKQQSYIKYKDNKAYQQQDAQNSPDGRGAARLVFLCVLLISFVCIFIFNHYTPLSTDDYSYGLEVRQAHGSLLQLLLQEKNQYFSWNGRSIVHFLLRVFLSLPTGIFKILNSFAFVGLSLLMYLNIDHRKKWDVFVLLLVQLGLWLFAVDFGDTILWETGSANYLWGTMIILGFMTLTRKLACQYGNASLAACIGILLFGVIAGWCNENTSGGALLYVLAMLVEAIWVQKHDKSKPSAIPVLAAAAAGNLIGMILMVAAPGNRFRASLSDEVYSGLLRYVSRFQKITLHLRDYFSILLAALIVFCVLLALQNRSKTPGRIAALLLRPLLFAFLFFATCYALILARPTQPRAFFGAGIFLLIAVIQAMRDAVNGEIISEKKQNENTEGGSGILARFLAYTAVGIMLLEFVFVFLENGTNLQRIYRDEQNRIQYILSEKAAGSDDITVPQIHPEFYNRFTALSPDTDMEENPTYWINIFYELYYDVTCISAIPYDDWKELTGQE